jgi:hypothetical protein
MRNAWNEGGVCSLAAAREAAGYGVEEVRNVLEGQER